jgi:ParB family chromosome partitioning protein
MRRALGKGLSQLIAEQYEGGPTEISVESITPNLRQPRTHFDEDALEELAQSIREFGVIQPLIVRPLSEGKYELIAGERRLRASKLAGLATVPVVVRSASSQNSLELALIENLQREDINAIESARAYRKLIDEFAMTQESVADRVGKSRTAVANTLRLLRLPGRILEGVSGGMISEGHARALLGFESEAHQLAVYDQILEKGLTVRDVERAARPQKAKASVKPADKPKGAAAAEHGPIEDALSTYFGAPCKIVPGPVGGKLTIDFYSDDDLQRILDVLGFSL